jgi:hypothetical protein
VSYDDADRTTPMVIPTAGTVEYHTHHHREHRSDVIAVTLFVLLTFTLGAIAVISANLTLSSTLDRLSSAPMCRETP